MVQLDNVTFQDRIYLVYIKYSIKEGQVKVDNEQKYQHRFKGMIIIKHSYFVKKVCSDRYGFAWFSQTVHDSRL